VLRFKNHLIAAALFVILAAIGTLMNSKQVAAQGPPDGLAVRIVNPLPVPTQGTSTVTGTVAATQSGTWKVGVNGIVGTSSTQSGPWNVGVNGTVGASQSGPWNVGVNGTVGASQSGPWNVGVNGTVGATQSGPWNVNGAVGATQNGAWNVGLTGTPTVNLNTSPSSPLIVSPVQPAVSQPFSAHFDYPGGTYSVPAGKQAVIEFVAFQGYGLPNGYYFVLLTTTANSQSNVYTLGPTFVQKDSDNNKQYTFGNHSLRVYADPGSTIQLQGQFAEATPGGSTGISISGFLVNYP
jgi:hypothetical protein